MIGEQVPGEYRTWVVQPSDHLTVTFVELVSGFDGSIRSSGTENAIWAGLTSWSPEQLPVQFESEAFAENPPDPDTP